MKAMILAAGRGERMRPLTDQCPKPLLQAGGKPLIVWHIEALVRAGLTDIVINHAYLGHMIEQILGDGSQWGACIQYSPESKALETAGGIANALSYLSPNGDEPFLVVNGDVFCQWPLRDAVALALSVNGQDRMAHLVLVPNPPQHPEGDFVLEASGLVSDKPLVDIDARIGTFSGIGIYHPDLFKTVAPGAAAPLAPLLRDAMRHQQVAGTWYDGVWMDIGTPDRLQLLDEQLQSGRLL